MLVKICGIMREEDGRMVEKAGADFLGINFVVGSKRCVSIDKAKEIINAIKDKSKIVLLFKDEDIERVVLVVKECNIKMVQLHGNEDAEYLKELINKIKDIKIIKAVMVKGKESINKMVEFYDEIGRSKWLYAFLLDSPRGGGSGEQFDWEGIVGELEKERVYLPKIFLAGGLNVRNLREAIELVRPDGVDVASGVESSVGVKDEEKVKEFIRIAKEPI